MEKTNDFIFVAVKTVNNAIISINARDNYDTLHKEVWSEYNREKTILDDRTDCAFDANKAFIRTPDTLMTWVIKGVNLKRQRES